MPAPIHTNLTRWPGSYFCENSAMLMQSPGWLDKNSKSWRSDRIFEFSLELFFVFCFWGKRIRISLSCKPGLEITLLMQNKHFDPAFQPPKITAVTAPPRQSTHLRLLVTTCCPCTVKAGARQRLKRQSIETGRFTERTSDQAPVENRLISSSSSSSIWKRPAYFTEVFKSGRFIGMNNHYVLK